MGNEPQEQYTCNDLELNGIKIQLTGINEFLKEHAATKNSTALQIQDAIKDHLKEYHKQITWALIGQIATAVVLIVGFILQHLDK